MRYASAVIKERGSSQLSRDLARPIRQRPSLPLLRRVEPLTSGAAPAFLRSCRKMSRWTWSLALVSGIYRRAEHGPQSPPQTVCLTKKLGHVAPSTWLIIRNYSRLFLDYLGFVSCWLSIIVGEPKAADLVSGGGVE